MHCIICVFYGHFGIESVPEPMSFALLKTSNLNCSTGLFLVLQVTVTDDELLDLEHRLLNARYGTELNDTQFQYGFPAGELKKVVEHWLLKFDWRIQEEQINQFPQFKTEIEGFDVHFIHVLPASGKQNADGKTNDGNIDRTTDGGPTDGSTNSGAANAGATDVTEDGSANDGSPDISALDGTADGGATDTITDSAATDGGATGAAEDGGNTDGTTDGGDVIKGNPDGDVVTSCKHPSFSHCM